MPDAKVAGELTGKEILLRALRGEETSRAAWVPYVGAHGGALIGETADKYLQSADLILKGLKKAHELYRPDGLPVMFDLQLEAEVLGCDLVWAKDGPPSVSSHPLANNANWTTSSISDIDFNKGRWPMVMDVTRRASFEFGEEVALYGLICGPFTLALHLLGNDIFIEMYDNPEKIEALVLRCAEIGKQVARAYIEAGCDIIGVVDPMVSQISPEYFTQFVTPAMNTLFDEIRNLGAISSCFVCGDVTRNLEVMLDTHCDSVSVDEQIDMSVLRDMALARNKSFGGNMKLTTVLLLGSTDDSKLHAIDVLETCGKEGFILSPGCDLPYGVPAENISAVAEVALDPYQRELARTNCHSTDGDTFDDIVIPNYDDEEMVILDVITLDSRTCAPCTYMMEAAHRGAEGFCGQVEVREHRITGRDGIGYLTKLGLRNLPTICIEGKPTFESIIPDDATLNSAIADALAKKEKVAV